MSTRSRSLLLAATFACVTAVGVCPAASAANVPRQADLRVTLVALPGTARVGGTVTYRARVENAAAIRATDVFMTFSVTDVDLVSVSAARLSCLASDGRAARISIVCSTRSLAGRSGASVVVVIRTRHLGTVGATVWASSSTHDPSARSNSAATRTRVAAPDLVYAEGARLAASRQQLTEELTVGAISAPNGGDVAGTFSLRTRRPNGSEEDVSGRVTCLSVSERTAAIGVVIERSGAALAARGGLMIFFLSDNGSPGGGRDTMTVVDGIGDPWTTPCVVPPAAFATSLIEVGEITIIDSH
jgi:hypothetical protein